MSDPPSRPPSPVHKRRRTQAPEQEKKGSSTIPMAVPTSPNSSLRHAVRAAMADVTSPSARQSRINEVFAEYSQRALRSARRQVSQQQPKEASAPKEEKELQEEERDSLQQQPQQEQNQNHQQQQKQKKQVEQEQKQEHSQAQEQKQEQEQRASASSSQPKQCDHSCEHHHAQSPCSHHDEPHSSCNHDHHHHDHHDDHHHAHPPASDEPAPAEPSTSSPSSPSPNPSVEPGVFPGGGIAPGCQHYSRNCWIKAACCNRYYPCRRCHDENETHEIDRHATQLIACVSCGHKDQPVASHCRQCGLRFARYFCHICRFYDDREDASAYHCHQCGICRVGKGLGIDNFHCNRCGNCVPLDAKDAHPCRERSLDANCPICTHYLATSTDQVVFLKCGHSMHVECLQQHAASSYTCPICHKCLTDMSAWYAQLDEKLANEVMPPEYVGRRSRILCYDCDRKSVTKFHFVYHKCAFSDCGAYNTRVLESLDTPPSDEDRAAAGAAASAGVPVATEVDATATSNSNGAALRAVSAVTPT